MSTNLNKVVNNSMIIDDQKEFGFFMSSYVVDALCRGQHFLGMNWTWKKVNPPIHVYFLELWDTKYKYKLKNIYDNFVSPLLLVLSFKPTPCMLDCAREVILEIGD